MNASDETRLNDLLDGLLDDAETRVLRERLAHEPELDHAWQEMRRLRHLLRQDDGLRAPADFGLQVRERIRTPATGTGRPTPRRGWVWLVPAAAVILLGLALGHRGAPEADVGARVETKNLVLNAPTPSLARKRSRRPMREATPDRRTLTLPADSLDEGKARLDDLLADQGLREGLLLETPPGSTILGTTLRRVTRAQYLRLRQVTHLEDDLPLTFDVRVVIILAKAEADQGTR